MKARKFPKPDDFTAEKKFPAGHRWAGKPRCIAWNPNRGRQCAKVPMKGHTTCRSHGAKGGRPLIHGRSSIPERLEARILELRGDPDLLSLATEIALNSVRIEELLKEAEVLEQQLDELSNREPVNQVRMNSIREKLANVWGQIRKHLEMKRKLVSEEWTHMDQSDMMVPLQTLMDMSLFFEKICLRHIPTHKGRAAFAREILSYLPEVGESRSRGEIIRIARELGQISDNGKTVEHPEVDGASS